MITTMATWTLTCILSAPGAFPRKESMNHLATPQSCEVAAMACWSNYYNNTQREDTVFTAVCDAIANHKRYVFSYTCDPALNCHRGG